MAKTEAKEPSANISIKLEGLRAEIEATVARYPACLKYQEVHDRVVSAAHEAATTAASDALAVIENKAAAFTPFSLDSE